MIEKLPDWEARLWAEINDSKPFRWGFNDCALFVANCALAMTGHDFAARARGLYDDEGGAYRYMAKTGARNLVEFADSVFTGLKRVSSSETREGDLLVIETPIGKTGAVHTGGTRVAMVAEEGVLLIYTPMPVLAAWRIP